MLLRGALTLMGNVKTAEFALRGASGINCLFSNIEVGVLGSDALMEYWLVVLK